MSPHHREQKAIAAVDCPTCGAPRGQGCRGPAIAGRLTICRARRTAWQAWRAAQGEPDYLWQSTTRGTVGVDHAMAILCPQSADAATYLRQHYPEARWLAGGMLVEGTDAPAITRQLTAARWRLA